MSGVVPRAFIAIKLRAFGSTAGCGMASAGLWGGQYKLTAVRLKTCVEFLWMKTTWTMLCEILVDEDIPAPLGGRFVPVFIGLHLSELVQAVRLKTKSICVAMTNHPFCDTSVEFQSP